MAKKPETKKPETKGDKFDFSKSLNWESHPYLNVKKEWHQFPSETDIEINPDFKTITFNFNRIDVVQAIALLESLIQEDK